MITVTRRRIALLLSKKKREKKFLTDWKKIFGLFFVCLFKIHLFFARQSNRKMPRQRKSERCILQMPIPAWLKTK